MAAAHPASPTARAGLPHVSAGGAPLTRQLSASRGSLPPPCPASRGAIEGPSWARPPSRGWAAEGQGHRGAAEGRGRAIEGPSCSRPTSRGRAAGPERADLAAVKAVKASTFQRPFHVAYDELERERDLQKIKDLFQAVDVDGSGFIDYGEFVRCVNNPVCFRILNQRCGLQKHQSKMMFAALDLDGDGVITLNEFNTLRTLLDMNQDGEVDARGALAQWKAREIRSRREGTRRRPPAAAGPWPRASSSSAAYRHPQRPSASGRALEA